MTHLWSYACCYYQLSVDQLPPTNLLPTVHRFLYLQAFSSHAFEYAFVPYTWNIFSFSYPIFSGVFLKVNQEFISGISSSEMLSVIPFPFVWENYLLLYLQICLLYFYNYTYSTVLQFVSMSSSLPDYGFL